MAVVPTIYGHRHTRQVTAPDHLGDFQLACLARLLTGCAAPGYHTLLVLWQVSADGSGVCTQLGATRVLAVVDANLETPKGYVRTTRVDKLFESNVLHC